jgi:hypothetical protein
MANSPPFGTTAMPLMNCCSAVKEALIDAPSTASSMQAAPESKRGRCSFAQLRNSPRPADVWAERQALPGMSLAATLA